jgi:probable phosphoglycerate mutase
MLALVLPVVWRIETADSGSKLSHSWDKGKAMTQVILTRHGQTEWNRVERFRGRADIPLNETGLEQAAATSRRIISTWKPVAVYTRPLSRAVRTAEMVAAPLGLTPRRVEELNDIDYGEWQGLTPEEVRSRWPDTLESWYRTPHLTQIPGGETLQSLLERAGRAVHSAIEQYPQETIVLVGHVSVNRVILLYALGLPLARYWHLGQGNCAINVLEASNGDFAIVSLNDTCHLTVSPAADSVSGSL